MRNLFVALFLILLVAYPAAAQISAPTKVEVKDEGTSQGRVGTFNFTGTPITCLVSGDTATCNLVVIVPAVEFEIDFAACNFGPAFSAYSCTKTVTDASVTATSKIMIAQSGIAASGPRPADENEMTTLLCNATPAAGTFALTCVSLQGPANGKYKLSYIIG